MASVSVQEFTRFGGCTGPEITSLHVTSPAGKRPRRRYHPAISTIRIHTRNY